LSELSVDAIFERIYIENETIEVLVGERSQAESLRVMLARRHAEIRALEPESNQSLCSSFDKDSGIAKYWIGPRKKNRGFIILTSKNDSEDSSSVAASL